MQQLVGHQKHTHSRSLSSSSGCIVILLSSASEGKRNENNTGRKLFLGSFERHIVNQSELAIVSNCQFTPNRVDWTTVPVLTSLPCTQQHGKSLGFARWAICMHIKSEFYALYKVSLSLPIHNNSIIHISTCCTGIRTANSLLHFMCHLIRVPSVACFPTLRPVKGSKDASSNFHPLRSQP